MKRTKIELTIHGDYVPSWGLAEGVREIVQNGIDGARQYGCAVSVALGEVGGEPGLLVVNKGGRIPREALLLGFTTKKDKRSLSGQFGEGLKLGMLALCRAGHTVKVLNQNELWEPRIVNSRRFNGKVLVIDITELGASEGASEDLRVFVGGITEERWTELKRMFLFVEEPKEKVSTYAGDLLLDEELRGAIYCKGIFVGREPDFRFGYNLNNVEIDRDRCMVRGWDLKWNTAAVWTAAIKTKPELAKRAYALLTDGCAEVELISCDSNRDAASAIAGVFEEEAGEDAVPVRNVGESKDLEHLGARGIVVGPFVAAVLDKALGSFSERKQKLVEKAFKVISYCDLTDVEKQNLEIAMEHVAGALPGSSLNMVNIVEWPDPTMLGQFKDNQVLVSRRTLADLPGALHVLVHEFCHALGGDGEKWFHDAVGVTLSEIAARAILAAKAEKAVEAESVEVQ